MRCPNEECREPVESVVWALFVRSGVDGCPACYDGEMRLTRRERTPYGHLPPVLGRASGERVSGGAEV
jgi:hypothetical protein